MPFVPPLSLGQRLLRERLRLHRSQEEVAEAIGTTARSINRWEHDKTVPHPHYRQQLCQIFQVSSETLFGTTPGMENMPSTLWNIPYRRNPFFTGREEVLMHLHTMLHSGNIAASVQAVSGLGGIGKTHIAVEYAHRFRDDYSSVFWVRAETRESLLADVVTLATLLNLSEKDEQDQMRSVQAVKLWLEKQTNWLLILDNVEDFALLADILPSQNKGHIVLTSRAQATGAFAQDIRLKEMEREEGALLLLRRAKVLSPSTKLEEVSETLQATARELSQLLGGLPLALDQTGAYIEETGCSLAEYQACYQLRQGSLLDRRGAMGGDHPHSMSITLSFCFEKVTSAHPAAGDLLTLCAFLAADDIPEEIFTEGGSELGQNLQSVTSNPLMLNETLALLRKYSLLSRNPETKTFAIHRLVQVVLKERMNQEMQQYWAERTVRVVNRAFPDGQEPTTWSRCERYLAHAEMCAHLIEQHEMTFSEAGRLLQQTGIYLMERGHYEQAESMLRKARVVQEQVLGQEHLEVAKMCNKLGELCMYRYDYLQAQTFFEQALTIHQKGQEPEHPDVAECLNNLAVLYASQEKYAQAEIHLQQALSIRERILGSKHPDVAQSLHNLARVYLNQGKYTQAEQLDQRALEMCEELLGSEHVYVAVCLSSLARLSFDQGRLAHAESLYQRALTIREQHLGREHPRTAQSLDGLARLYYEQERYDQAEPLFQRVLDIRERELGREHPDTVVARKSYANVLRKLKREEEAIGL